jgi:hypothetical protein
MKGDPATATIAGTISQYLFERLFELSHHYPADAKSSTAAPISNDTFEVNHDEADKREQTYKTNTPSSINSGGMSIRNGLFQAPLNE